MLYSFEQPDAVKYQACMCGCVCVFVRERERDWGSCVRVTIVSIEYHHVDILVSLVVHNTVMIFDGAETEGKGNLISMEWKKK